MTGLLAPESLESVIFSLRRATRTDPLLERIAMPDLRPFAASFNDALAGDDDGQLAAVCEELVREASLEPATVIQVATQLAEIFVDEIGTQSGATTRSLVNTLGFVCRLLTTTLVGDVEARARRDALTGLENKVAWDEALAELLDVGTQVSIAMIDLDGLKQINDSKGHQAGNAHLRAFGAALHEAVPEGARAFRWAGDEYAVIFAETSPDRASAVLDGLRDMPACAPFSYGVAATPADGFDPATLEKAADDRMYADKNARKASQRPVASPTAPSLAAHDDTPVDAAALIDDARPRPVIPEDPAD